MIQSYFKIIIRHFLKDKQFTLLNLLGLTMGIVSTFLICLWIFDELGTDKFHEKDNRLYEVMIHEKGRNGTTTSNGTGDRLGEILLKEMPEVETAVATTPSSWFQKFSLSAGNKTLSAKGNFVSKDYFKVFSFPLIQGNNKEVLAHKNSIAISEKLAIKLYGSAEKATGKIIEWKWQTSSGKCMISGIFQDFPSKSSQQYDFLLSMDAWNQIIPKSDIVSSSGPFNNFIVLKQNIDIDYLNQRMASLSRLTFNDSSSQLFVRKYSDAYLFGKYENGVQAGGRIHYVSLFAVIAVIILIIACINFMNLSTAKASLRSKEIGVKKALGAGRYSLISQFLGESLLMSFIALFFAICLAWFLLPHFNGMTGKQLTLNFDIKTILILLVVCILTGLLAGSYPAFHLSRFSPSITLKGRFSSSSGELLIRKGLVIFQFTISVVLILSVFVVYKQIDYLQHKDLGYDKENQLYFEMDGRIAEHPESFLTQLKEIPGVENASSIQQKIVLPAMQPGTGSGVRWEGKNTDDKVRFQRMPVNYGLIETLGIKMSEGRSFSKNYSSENTNIILNESAVQSMELQNPVGKTITIGGQPRHIIGVSKNFHFNSLHEQIRPFILYLSPAETTVIIAKIAAGNKKETIEKISNFFKIFNPGYSFDYQFLNRDYQIQYASENLIGEMVKYFALLAIIISCLGLFGLTTFTAERRKKEIGIRKVLGATVINIVTMLTRDFLVLILISIVVATPVAWWLMSQWLQNFAYRISIGLGIFIITAIMMILMTFITMGYLSIKSALMNPVKSLKAD